MALMLAWRRCVLTLPLLAFAMAGATSAFATSPDAIELAQAQPQAQPTPEPTPTPATPQTPVTAAPAADAASSADEPIGNVATVTGIATVIRNKNSIALKVRDDIYLNDAVQTSSNSSLGITFNDSTTFNLSANAKITIDNYIYEDGGKQNAAIFDIGRGTVAFVAAAVAKTGDMKITTPTATLGIRGTTGVVEVPQGGTASAAAANNVNIKLYPDADGRVGRIEVNDRTTGGRLGFLTQASSGFAIRPGTDAMRFAAVPITITPREVQRDRAFVRQVYAAQTTGRQIVTEQREFRRNNPGLNNRNQPQRPGQPVQPQQPRQNGAPGQPQQQNGLPGQNRITPKPPVTPNRQGTLPQRQGGTLQPGTPHTGQGQQQGNGQGRQTGAPHAGQTTPQITPTGGAAHTQLPHTGQTPPPQPGAATPPPLPTQPQQGGLQRPPGLQQQLPGLQHPGQLTRPAPRKPVPPPKEKNERR